MPKKKWTPRRKHPRFQRLRDMDSMSQGGVTAPCTMSQSQRCRRGVVSPCMCLSNAGQYTGILKIFAFQYLYRPICLLLNGGGQDVDQSVKFLLTHAMGEQEAGKCLGKVNFRQLFFVIDTGIIHQAHIETQRHQRIADISIFLQVYLKIVFIGDQIVVHDFIILGSA